MSLLRNKVSPILLATLWISLSEFVRNEFLLKSYWIQHYENMGLNFPAAPVNGAIWGVWSLLFAVVIYVLAGKYSLLYTFLLAWCIGFILMWVVIGNLGVLPFGILPYAVPLSLLEAFIASWMIHKLIPKRT